SNRCESSFPASLSVIGNSLRNPCAFEFSEHVKYPLSPSSTPTTRSVSLIKAALRSSTSTTAHRPSRKVDSGNVEARNVGWANLVQCRRGHPSQSLEYSPILSSEK